MADHLVPDERLLARLPLPLAQLFRRAANSKSEQARHSTALSIAEAGLKHLASTAIVDYAALPQHDPDLVACLQKLARPSLGHWWEFARRLVPVLADTGDARHVAVRDVLLGRTRDDCPRAAGLDAALLEVLNGQSQGRSTVRFSELFDRIVQYRNREFGHGAVAQKPEEFHRRMAAAFLGGMAEVFDRLDVLAGRRLLYVSEVRQTGGIWLVQRHELMGVQPRRVPSLELPRDAADRLPDGERLYLEDPAIPDAPLRALHPLACYDFDREAFFLLDSRRGRRHSEYLCYTTGERIERADLGTEQRRLLAQVLRIDVTAEQTNQWSAASQAEEPPLAVEAVPPQRRMLGEFELISELGRGGMGVVYRAWQPSLHRQVAVKKLLGGGGVSEQRFAREIRALGRVENPNLVKVYTSGTDGDDWYYALELIEGAPLSDVCEKLQGATTSAGAAGEAADDVVDRVGPRERVGAVPRRAGVDAVRPRARPGRSDADGQRDDGRAGGRAAAACGADQQLPRGRVPRALSRHEPRAAGGDGGS